MLLTDSIKSQLEWLSQLEIAPPKATSTLDPKLLRKTAIIATIGPKTNNVEMLKNLRATGMNVVRMNFSHGSYEYHKSVIDNARAASSSIEGRPLGIALDTKGPEIRTGKMANGEDIKIKAGHQMTITTDPKYKDAGDDKFMYVDYSNITSVISKGKTIYIDDGILQFVVEDVQGNNLLVRAFNDGTLSSYKGVNLPGTDVDLPALSEKDKADLDFGVENGVDMIFASFIRRAEDVRSIRKHLGEKGAYIKIISKIENLQGVQNFDEILKETDGVMVARGDLGIEIPASQVFVAQKMMIAKCQLAGKPSICATQMLESMTNNPRPTRAEVSDVANAVLDGADCVMLSGETAKGAYPLLAVAMMAETCYLAESTICYPPLFNELRALTPIPTDTTETVAMAAVAAAHEQNAGAILVMSTSGNTARLISKYRPAVPILTITRNERTSRQLHLHRGCYPFFYKSDRPSTDANWQEDVDARIRYGLHRAIELKILEQNTTVIAVQGWRAGGNATNTIRVLSHDSFNF